MNNIKIIMMIVFITSTHLIGNNKAINASLKTAKVLEKRGEVDAAISVYNSILEKSPNHNTSIQRIKRLYLNHQRYEEGIQFLKNRMKVDRNNVKLLTELGELYYLNKEEENAESTWSSGLVQYKNNRLFYRLMVSLFGKYGLDSDIERITQIGRGKFGPSFLAYETGVYFQARKAYDKAMDQFLLYLIHEPKQIGIIERRIMLMSDEIDALAIIENKLKAASEREPRKVLNVLSEFYFKKQNYEQAFNTKKRWSSLENRTFNEWIDFSNELRKEGQYKYAIKGYNYILKQKLHSNLAGQALLGLAKTFEDQIVPDQRRHLIPYFYDNSIFFEDPFQVYSSISKSHLTSSLELYDSLLITLKKSSLLSEAYFKIGEIQYRILQDFDKAKLLFIEALENNPEKKLKLKIILRIADVLIAQGRLEEALSFLDTKSNQNPLPQINMKKTLVHFLVDDPDSTLKSIDTNLYEINPGSALFNDLMGLKNLINKYYTNDPNDRKAFMHFLKSEKYLRQKKLGDAIQELTYINSEFKNTKIVPLINLRLSLIYYKLNDYDLALESIKSLRDSDLADKGIILQGQIFEYKFLDIDEALNNYMQILDQFPKSIFSEPIRYHIREVQKMEI
tara:strand:+ start:7409 stop:9271 length:1863 start_codon:yes stop_codon:yes gene_type:complete